jgi:hypothetical protein
MVKGGIVIVHNTKKALNLNLLAQMLEDDQVT